MSCASCSCDSVSVHFNNDHTLTLTGLRDANSAYLNGATITYQFYDYDNELVTGASGSLTASGSNGNYSATIDKAIIALLSNGNEYSVRITGAQGDTDFEFNLEKVIPSRRGSS